MSDATLARESDDARLDGTMLSRRATRLLKVGDEAEGKQVEEDLDAATRALSQEAARGGDDADSPSGSRVSRPTENKATEGVNILVRLARSGQEQAAQAKSQLTDLLRTGRGITQGNLVEVLSAIQCQTTEPVVLAARKVFSNLTAAPGRQGDGRPDVSEMTVTELQEKLEKMFKREKERGEVQPQEEKEALETIIEKTVEYGDKDEEVVSEEEFLAVAISYANGTLPGGNLQALSETNQFKHMRWTERWDLDKLKTMRYIMQHGLHLAEERGERYLMKAIPYYQLTNIFFLYIVTYVIVPRVMWFVVPLLLFYSALALMIIGSLQEIWFQRLFKLYHVYSVVFRKSNHDLPVEAYEARFTLKQGVHAPIIFFLAYTVLVGAQPLAIKHDVLSEPLAALSLAMAALCFLACSGYHLPEIRWSMLARLASAVLALVSRQGWLAGTPLGAILFEAWPSVPLATTGIQVSIGPETALTAASVLLLAVAGVRHGRASWLQVVVPHFFFLAWLDVATLLGQGCSWSGFATTVTALAAIPFSPLLVTLAPVYLALSSGTVAVGLVILAMLLVAGASVLALKYTDYKQAERWFAKLQTSTQVLVVGGAGLAVAILMGLAHSSYTAHINPLLNQSVAPLTWNYYTENCHNLPFNHTADRQLKCRHFNGQLIKWNATVTDVRIAGIDNSVRSTLTGIPWGLGYYFYRIGFPSTECQGEGDGVDCILKQRAMSGLDKLDTYKYLLTVMLDDNHTLSLTVGHHLTTYIAQITPMSTKIQFTAPISNAGGEGGPSLAAKKVVVYDRDGYELHNTHAATADHSVAEELERSANAMLKGLAGFFVSVSDLPGDDVANESEAHDSN